MIRPRIIEVWAWGTRVGAVAPDYKRGCYAFEYDPSWKELGVELAPITLPRDSSRTVFLFPTLPERTFYRLPHCSLMRFRMTLGTCLSTHGWEVTAPLQQ
jgi:serine/threonine-protein kinase HipA